MTQSLQNRSKTAVKMTKPWPTAHYRHLKSVRLTFLLSKVATILCKRQCATVEAGPFSLFLMSIGRLQDSYSS